jgi:hypothetical protein
MDRGDIWRVYLGISRSESGKNKNLATAFPIWAKLKQGGTEPRLSAAGAAVSCTRRYSQRVLPRPSSPYLPLSFRETPYITIPLGMSRHPFYESDFFFGQKSYKTCLTLQP